MHGRCIEHSCPVHACVAQTFVVEPSAAERKLELEQVAAAWAQWLEDEARWKQAQKVRGKERVGG